MCATQTSGPARPPRAGQRGLSIVELMVGMVVALLVGLAATGSAAVFSASQRQGIGVGGAQVNSGTALNAIRDDAAAAGLGFFGDSQYLCNRLNLGVGTTAVQDGDNFSPIRITAEAAGDRVDVIYATQVASGANVLIEGPSTPASAAAGAVLKSLLPVAVNEAVLIAPPSAGDPCLVRSVTAVTASTPYTPQELAFGSAGDHNQAAFTTNAAYPDRSRVALLGQLRWARYRLSGTDLQLERPLVAGAPVVLARNVVAFRAQYGLRNAAAGSTSLETWQDATGAFAAVDATTLPRVRALRIGMVTRSPQREKPDAAGNCAATSTLPRDPLDSTRAITPDVTDWQCYRYRTAVAVVPLRNLVVGAP